MQENSHRGEVDRLWAVDRRNSKVVGRVVRWGDAARNRSPSQCGETEIGAESALARHARGSFGGFRALFRWLGAPLPAPARGALRAGRGAQGVASATAWARW